ncbi:MAG: hypothetical protein H7125_12085 [Proteobacteria bacterium]|nr:hypothetical protein [Burkholderiales bacterium]
MAAASLVGACAVPPSADTEPKAHLPLARGWYDGQEVFYVTTDVSTPEVAKAKGANYAPRLADAVVSKAARATGQGSSLDKVYAVANFKQGSVFASAPEPMGAGNKSRAYSPLWQMVTVTWRPGQVARILRSQEEILEAVDKGALMLTETDVVLNCPIVHLGAKGGLPGVSIDRIPAR